MNMDGAGLIDSGLMPQQQKLIIYKDTKKFLALTTEAFTSGKVLPSETNHNSCKCFKTTR